MTGGEQGSGDLAWRDGIVPVSLRFDDPYFSITDGLAETRHVFLAGNGLPDRLCDGFHVAELGFGTGLNLLALQIAWAGAGRPGTLRYTSFEAFPLPAADIARALEAFPEARAVADPFLEQWAQGARRLTLPGIEAPRCPHGRHGPMRGFSMGSRPPRTPNSGQRR
jgi:tRNA U34 5-methylaminomethyl-2-thiouridine-forming methyltransferase MnmC